MLHSISSYLLLLLPYLTDKAWVCLHLSAMKDLNSALIMPFAASAYATCRYKKDSIMEVMEDAK
jgi:hypothetical protein